MTVDKYKRMLEAQTQDEILTAVLNNLVWYVVKNNDDAPMSASTHFNTAIYDLLRLVPGYKAPELSGEDGRAVIVEACTEMKLLIGE